MMYLFCLGLALALSFLLAFFLLVFFGFGLGLVFGEIGEASGDSVAFAVVLWLRFFGLNLALAIFHI
jgi:hypothetical protein